MVDLIRIPGVMTREMIKHYGDKRIYAPAAELEKATRADNFIPICLYPTPQKEHGALDRKYGLPLEEIRGWAKLRYEDTKVKTDLFFDPLTLSPETLEWLQTLRKDNLSPGFWADEVEEAGSFYGQSYSHVQRNIKWGHIAVVSQGMCSDRDGCGLYKETFDSVQTGDSAPLQPLQSGSYLYGDNDTLSIYQGLDTMPDDCVKAAMANGASEAEAKAKCAEKKDAEITALKAQLEAKDLLLQQHAETARVQLLETVHQKTGIAKDKLESKTTEVLEALLELAPTSTTPQTSPPGQSTGGQTPGSPPPSERTEAKEDPELFPGLRQNVGIKAGLLNPIPIRQTYRDGKRVVLPDGEL